jgi:DNA-binding GntR family transcriptional regulator
VLLSSQAYAVLKQALIRCELEPGSYVSEGDLIERYGLGRAAVRTALSRLGQEALVHPHPRRGHHVSEIRLQDVRDVFDVRAHLEPLATARAAERRTDMDVIRSAEKRYRDSIFVPGEASTIADYLAADTNFHLTVVAAGGNDRMTRVLRDMFDVSERLFHLTLRVIEPSGDLRDGHRPLVDAIARQDADAARQITAEKLRRSEELVIGALTFVTSEPVAAAARAINGRG